MARYETLYLAVPEITADESAKIESQFDKIISDAKGKVISFDRWGKYQLTYPIRDFEYGVYYLVRFEIGEDSKIEVLKTIENFFAVRSVDLVMRHMVKRLSSHGSLDYKRPESLEEAPTRDVDAFLKENKMTGLLGKSSHNRHDEDGKDFESAE